MYNEGNKSIFKSIDWTTICLYVVLATWGWFSVCGASYDFSNPDVFGMDTNSGKQLLWICTSLCLACMLLFVEKDFWDKYAFHLYLFMICVLILTIIIAPETKGSRSWLPIGTFMKIQPAEFAKFTVALAIGKLMNRYGYNIHKYNDFIRVVFLIVLPMVLIVCQKETGTALVYLSFFLVLYREGMTGAFLFSAFAAVLYFVVGIRFGEEYFPVMPVSIGEFTVLLTSILFSIGMLYVFCRNWKAVKIMLIFGGGISVLAILFSVYVIPFNVCYVFLGVNILIFLYIIGMAFYYRKLRYWLVGLFALGSTGFYYMCNTLFNSLDDHQRVRIEVLLGMKEDLRGAGYNVNQAKIAIGSGGLTGKGFLNGTQTKLRYVPEQDTDFIFCTVGEEEGFLGASAVLIVYLMFIWRLIVVAERQPDTLGRVYGYSVLCIFLFHLFINVAMVLGLTPVIGIPLPFFSYGGSSLWGFTILLFIFLRMDAERNIKRR
jgi:rod shape determining protein RodA